MKFGLNSNSQYTRAGAQIHGRNGQTRVWGQLGGGVLGCLREVLIKRGGVASRLAFLFDGTNGVHAQRVLLVRCPTSRGTRLFPIAEADKHRFACLEGVGQHHHRLSCRQRGKLVEPGRLECGSTVLSARSRNGVANCLRGQ